MVKSAAMTDLLAIDEVGGKPENPCPVCGGGSYSWGTLGAQGINFTADDASIFAKFFRYGISVRARRCDLCGNVQIFARAPETEGE
jgi:hypothetical protein